MGKIVVSQFISLDGVMEAPEKWNSSYRDDKEVVQEILDDFSSSDVLLFGRTTYEQFAERWPQRAGDMAAWFNALPKYIASTTLKQAAWNNSIVLTGDTCGEVKKLQQQQEKNILVFGSYGLVQTLMKEKLIDEYKLYVYPLTLGTGKRLFEQNCTPQTMKLMKAVSFTSGVVAITSQPNKFDYSQ